MIESSNIPNSWSVKTIREIVLNSKNGGTPKKSKEEFWNGDIDWINSGEVRGKYTSSGEQKITEKGLNETSAKMFPEDSVLIAMYGGKGTIGRATIVKEPVSGNQAICCLEVDKDIVTPEYLYYYSMVMRGRLEDLARGASQDNINQEIILEQEIPVPPLDEQERIVEAVEERLDRVERLETSVSNIGRLANEYEDSYLAYLVTGGSESAVENLGNNLTEEDVPDNWAVKQVSDVVSAKNGGTPKRSEEKYWGGDIPWLSSGEVQNTYTNSADESIDKSAIQESSAKLFPENSVLVAMYGSGTRGKSTIITDEMSGNQAICCLVPTDEILTKYLLYFYKSIENRLASKARGAAQRNLNQSMVVNEMMPVPPVEEQKKIIKNIERYNFSKVQNSSSLLSDYFEEYRGSVLSYAFKGKI